jgi:regulator of cell morphogenesis and NO signaling
VLINILNLNQQNMISAEKKVSEVVASNIKTAHVFKKYGIDFCCGGGVSLSRACEKNQVDLNQLLSDLASVDEKILPSQNYNAWQLDFLINYIVNTHHQYVTEALAMIDSYAEKVAKVHGEGHPPVIKIYELFKLVASELSGHMKKEELILFPYINKMVQSQKLGLSVAASHFGSVINPITMMEQEHETAGNLMKEIAQLTNSYTPPEWACNTFKALYAKLEEFEQDLHMHVHLENNILFPKAVLLEESFVSFKN